jgi:hypothetical protein
MYSFILNCDFLGPKPNLYYFSQDRYKTLLGSLVTILIGILSILAFVGFGYNLLARKNPTGIFGRDLNEDILIKQDDMFFLFAPHLMRGERLATKEYDRKFGMKMRYLNTDTISPDRATNMTIQLDIPLVQCINTQKYQSNYHNVTEYMTLNHSDYYCVPDGMDITGIQGKQGTAKFAFWTVILE